MTPQIENEDSECEIQRQEEDLKKEDWRDWEKGREKKRKEVEIVFVSTCQRDKECL